MVKLLTLTFDPVSYVCAFAVFYLWSQGRQRPGLRSLRIQSFADYCGSVHMELLLIFGKFIWVPQKGAQRLKIFPKSQFFCKRNNVFNAHKIN